MSLIQTDRPIARCRGQCEIGIWTDRCALHCKRAAQHQGSCDCLTHISPPDLIPNKTKEHGFITEQYCISIRNDTGNADGQHR